MKYKTKILILFATLLVISCWANNQEHFNQIAADPENKPDEVIKSLNIQKGWLIGDLGAGGGYYSFRLSEATGDSGKVFAADINSDYLTAIKKEAKEKNISNIETVLSDPDNSHFEDNSLDLIFIRNTFHHFENRKDYMKRLAEKLRAGGRIAIIDYKETASFSWHRVSRDDIVNAMEGSGLELEKEFNFLDKQYFLVYKKK